jgi:hypothetical protein
MAELLLNKIVDLYRMNRLLRYFALATLFGAACESKPHERTVVLGIGGTLLSSTRKLLHTSDRVTDLFLRIFLSYS